MSEAAIEDRLNPTRANIVWAVTGRFAGRVLGLALLLLVLALTLSDEVARPQLMAGQDKVEHILAFLALAFVFGWGASLWALLAFGVGLTGVSFGIEALQETLTTTREGAFSDALAGCIGIGVGLSLAFVFNQAIAVLARRRSARRALAK